MRKKKDGVEPGIYEGYDSVAEFLQSDILLGSEFWSKLRRKFFLEPEQELMLAILWDAVRCFQDNIAAAAPKQKKLFEETEEWFLADDDWLFSFNVICEVLGLSPNWMYNGLKKWKEKHQRGSIERADVQHNHTKSGANAYKILPPSSTS
jgi:hypothetical protein